MILIWSIDPGATLGWRFAAWCEECPSSSGSVPHLFMDKGGEQSMGWTDEEETASVLAHLELVEKGHDRALDIYCDRHMSHLKCDICRSK